LEDRDYLAARRDMNGGSGINRRDLISKSLAGLIGGALGWLPAEIVTHGRSITDPETTGSVVGYFVSMAILSALIGALVVAAEGQSLELTAQTKRRFVRGLIICLVLSIPATFCSGYVFGYVVRAGGWGPGQPGSLPYLVLGRLLSWTIMGLMLGAGVGLASLSPANIVKGAVGGWVGGFLGGASFDVIGALINVPGSDPALASRFLGFCAIGLAIGLFIGLVQELTKTAWLSVEAGRLRGRQYRLERALATLGRAEENAVGLFGDADVLPRHAEIARQADRYILKSLSPQHGVFLNGGRIESADLHEGDRIRIGNYELAFHLRNAPAAASRMSPAPRAAGTPVRGLAPIAAASANGLPRLVDPDGHDFAIHGGAITRLGRALDNDIVVNHASVSRYHANIVSRNGAFELVDLNSRNGTWLAGSRIIQAQISNGDSIRLGDVQFTFRA
jgi:pSer/pThr/pTyr-binding forkhead associated (FHA) protein